MKRLSLTVQSLLALAAGLGLGILGHELAAPAFEKIALGAKAVGAIWVAALQLTVLPLVITHLLAAISGTGAKSVGKLGIRAFVLFLLMLIASGLFATFLTPPLVARLSVDADAVSSLSADATPGYGPGPGAAKANAESTSTADWISTLLPSNLLEAGMKGDIFPLLLFTAFFAVAVTRLPEERHQLLTKIFQGLAEAMLQLTRWVLVVTPVGVFALTYMLAFRTGASVGGVLGAYILIVSVLLLLFTLVLYPLTAFVGRTNLSNFARAAAPAQMVAASTRSSIAALPALVEGGRDHLHLPPTGTGFVLPLSVSLLKVNRPISSIVKLMLVAHIYSIPLRPTTIILFLTTVIIEAVEAIPDVFKTVLNVTGDMSAATLLTRSYRSSPSQLTATDRSTPAEGML
jgi:proton glutamate symport protein